MQGATFGARRKSIRDCVSSHPLVKHLISNNKRGCIHPQLQMPSRLLGSNRLEAGFWPTCDWSANRELANRLAELGGTRR